MRMLLALIERQFAYETWANSVVLACMRRAGQSVPQKALRLMGHIAAARQIWYSRVDSHAPAPRTLFPELSPDVCEALLAEFAAKWTRFLASSNDSILERPISYTTVKGVPYTHSISDILQHLSLHGAYHRGQVVMILKTEGLEIPNPGTDFIEFVRISKAAELPSD